MRTTDEAGNPYPMLEFSSPDFARLQAAVGDRAPDLRLHLTRAYGYSGPLVIEVMAPGTTPGAWDLTAYITRHQQAGGGAFGWHIHHPTQGPQMDFRTCQQVAKFLSAVPRFSEGWTDAWNHWMLARGELFASE